VHATPQYAHVRFLSGRETTLCLQDVAPVGEQRLDPRPMLSQGLHWTHSFRPVEILAIAHLFHLQSRPKHLSKRLYAGHMMIKTSATSRRTTSERVKPGRVFVRPPPSSAPQILASTETCGEIWSCTLLVIMFSGGKIVAICYLASLVNCDRALEQSRLIA